MYTTIIQTLEAAIAQLGLQPEQAKLAEGQYNLSKDGHTEVLLDVWEEQDRVFFQALSPVTKLNDAGRAEVLRMLLEENHGLIEAAFALAKDDIILKHTMECTALFNEAQVISALSRIAYYSQAYREKWQTLSQAI